MVDKATIAGGLQTLAAASTNTVANNLAATGTTRADSLQLTADVNNVTGGATGTGVDLPAAPSGGPGDDVIIFNSGANPIKVYAPGGQTIDGTAGATGVTLTNAKRCIFILMDPNTWISAQLGVTSA